MCRSSRFGVVGRVRGLVGKWVAGAGLVLILATLPGCGNRESGQLPEVSGEAIQAKRDEIKEFAVVRAYPDQDGDTLAIALEFSRPLVGTQEFDELLAFDNAPAEKSGWKLDDSASTRSFHKFRSSIDIDKRCRRPFSAKSRSDIDARRSTLPE